MATENDLAHAINDYTNNAQVLEGTRQSLVERIMGVVKTEIIPELIPLLPPRYSIDASGSEVYGVTADQRHDSVPTGFAVYLRLNYDGKPVPSSITFENLGKIGEILHPLKPELERLAQKYNLERIMPHGEPGRF